MSADSPLVRSESIAAGLAPLPEQPAGTPWPTQQWARGEPACGAAALEPLAARVFDLPDPAVTYALLVVHRGKLVFERYAHGASPIYLQYSWSMAKSLTQALVGVALREGHLDLYGPCGLPAWSAEPNDPRAAITLDQLLRMSSGLAFREDYDDPMASDVIPMLALDGRRDCAGFAARKPLEHPVGEVWSYSSGTSNIVCRLLRDAIGGPSEQLAFAREHLFEPIGARTPLPTFDHSGTFVGSSFCQMTPEDFARFGYLYLRDGMWEGQRILPEGWVDYARTPTYQDAEQAYGAHWWLVPGSSRFYANGYDGQRILVCPEEDLVVVRCGRTRDPHIAGVWDALSEIADRFRA